MAGYLICVDKESGVPIFARKLGDIPHMESPIAASLNGVRIFGRAHGVELLSTLTENARFLWKDFRERIILIFGGTDDTGSELHLNRMLDNVFSAMAFHIGLENLLRPGSLDRLRRQMRFAYPTIDKILHGLRPTELTMYFSDLTACIDTQFHSMQTHSKAKSFLMSVVQHLDIVHAVLYSVCTVLASTPKWTEINTSDRILIGLATQGVVFTDTDESVIEIPAYLPKSDPDTPLRLVVVLCSSTLRISILCGRTPDIQLVRSEAAKALKNFEAVQQLSLSAVSPPRKLFNVHPHVQGFLIRNTHDRVCAFAVFPDSEDHPNSASASGPGAGRLVQKLEGLRIFFRNTVPDIFPWSPGQTSTLATYGSQSRAKESMWSSQFHRCHALKFGPYQLFVMYDVAISQPVMRKSSAQLLRDVLRDRAVK